MELSKLISTIGEDNLMLQSIDGSLVKSVDKKRTKDTELTIATNQVNTNDAVRRSGKVGIIVWFDRDQFNEATK